MISFSELTFSDAAKFADVARNLINGEGWQTSFAFYGSNFEGHGILPFHVLNLVFSFKLFGISDSSVILVSLFYYILSLVFVYLLAQKLFNSVSISILSTIAIGTNIDILNYAANGGSESAFIFLIIISFYFISQKKVKTNILTLFMSIFMYFTRPHAFIYITGLVLFFLLINSPVKKALRLFAAFVVFAIAFDYIILSKLTPSYFLYPIISRGASIATNINIAQSPSDSLRGTVNAGISFVDVFKKIFYNLYNFYRLLPQIMSPYLWGFFVLGLFNIKNNTEKAFKISVIFMVVVTFFVAAATIPFFRYIHPVVPFIYILGVATVVRIASMFVGKNRKALVVGVSSFVILISTVGQTLGVIFLDSRFEKNIVNTNRPHIYVSLAKNLKNVTDDNMLIITNLDTWGTWYGERKTVWFPLEPQMLANKETGEVPFDAVYLTNYLMDDQNYYMGEEWREIFENPQGHDNEFFSNNYTFRGEYIIPASETYENIEGRAVLFVKK